MLLAAVLAVVGYYSNRAIVQHLAEARAIAVIEQNGAAISKPAPDVIVFVPQSGGGERQFGDRQLGTILPVLGDLSRFRGLQLDGSSITDASMTRLKDLPQLEFLDVSRTAVTVAGLLELRSLPNLKILRTDPTQLSAEDRNRLMLAMPRVKLE